MNGISIIIPTYNRAGFLRGTLSSLHGMRIPEGTDIEVLVIDNNCTDDTATVVADSASAFSYSVRHIVETHQGLCYGRNRGIAEARFEHLAYLDDDIHISPDWIISYFEAYNEHSADAVVGPVLPRFLQPKPDYLEGKVLDSICSPYSRRGDQITVLPENRAHELPGCNFGVTKAAANEVHGFDNTLDRIGDRLISGGDFDFGRRLVREGKRTVYHPGCWIEHVIIPEKLSKRYLRKRAIGAGMTSRAMDHPGPLGWQRSISYAMGTAKSAYSSVALRLVGRYTDAFERELQTLTSWGYLWGGMNRNASQKG